MRVVLVLLAACSFSAELDGASGDDGPPSSLDCPSVGAMCEGDVLHECRVKGEPSTPIQCAWGCLSTGTAHCGEVQPAGGAVMPDALGGTGLADKSISGRVNSDTGEIIGHRMAGIGIKDGIDFSVANGVGIFRFAKLTISGTLELRGTNAVALVSLGDITVNENIDARGDCMERNAGPGGSPGAMPRANAMGMGGGTGGTGPHDNSSGGGGGGHATNGAPGGKSASTQNPPGGTMFGDVTITTLRGGGGGGGGGGPTGGAGGGGGGAVQLLANGTIRIAAMKGINAGGCGGGGTTDDSGGGGGAGGTILIEAPTIEIADMGGLAVNGGGGGGADAGQPGADGEFSTDRATAGGGGEASGGMGGAAAGLPTAGGNAKNSGGGGGAHGRIRINTRPGRTPTLSLSAFCSPTLGTYATLGTANVQ